MDKRQEETAASEEIRQGDLKQPNFGAGSTTGPAANTRAKVKCRVCCCASHCEYTIHFPAKVRQVDIHLAMDTEGMCVEILQTVEEDENTDDEVGDLMVLLNSVNLDISTVFKC